MFGTFSELLITAAALGASIMAGVYFAFSGFIMRSLDRLDSELAVDAMNSINEVILRSWFMPLFFGSTLLYLILGAMAGFSENFPNRMLIICAALVYIAGMFLCTVFYNVPLNNSLARTEKTMGPRDKSWEHYFKYWTRWNQVRTFSCLAASVLSIYSFANFSST